MRSKLPGRRSGEDGQSLVEFALVLPVLVLVVLGVIRIGNLYSQYQTIVSATSQGARTEAICRTGSQDALTVATAAAKTVPSVSFSFTDASSGAAVSHAAGCATAPGATVTSGQQIKVTGSATAQIVSLGVMSISVPISSTVTIVEE
jgi:Flp pilus assembly protein TadG